MKTYPIAERESKVNWTEFAGAVVAGASVQRLIDGLPDILKGKDFKSLVDSIAWARGKGKPVIAMLGGHVIKCGLSPVIVSLVKEKVITAVAMNGAASIHDFEMAMFGCTSENVEENLPAGMFGMWEEIGRFMNEAINDGQSVIPLSGTGEALSRYLSMKPASSVLGVCYANHIPVTVHIAIGTDTIHYHWDADGGKIGNSTFIDLKCFYGSVCELGGGGVILNFGSAVLLPEIFLKCLNLAINEGFDVTGMVSANFDMIQHYRGLQNMVKRVELVGGTGYSFTGHHEIMIPLLGYAVLDAISGATDVEVIDQPLTAEEIDKKFKDAEACNPLLRKEVKQDG